MLSLEPLDLIGVGVTPPEFEVGGAGFQPFHFSNPLKPTETRKIHSRATLGCLSQGPCFFFGSGQLPRFLPSPKV